jgi:hypothetical protein
MLSYLLRVRLLHVTAYYDSSALISYAFTLISTYVTLRSVNECSYISRLQLCLLKGECFVGYVRSEEPVDDVLAGLARPSAASSS